MEKPRELTSAELGESDDGRKSASKVGAKSEEGSTPSEPDLPPEKELLLCLRPIREVDKKLRYGCRKKKSASKKSSPSPNRSDSTKPPKKRRPETETLDEEAPTKKPAPEPEEQAEPDCDEVAESLMAMNKQSSA